MASREEIARVIAQLRDTPQFWHYVKMLEERRDAVIHQIMYEQTPDNVNVLRGEARAYDTLIKQIHSNLGN